ncbi:MAG: hypothetical protein Tsb0015_06450 [Simkaniaceae bacterium]
MHDISWMVTKSLLESLPKEEKTASLQHLHPDDQWKYKETLTNFNFYAPAKPLEELIYSMHHSWLLPVIKELQTEDQKLFLAALTGQQAQQLKTDLNLDFPTLPLEAFLEEFILQEVFERLVKGHNFIPKEYLPPHPLNILLHLNREQFLKLFDFLGIHDLALDLKKMIQANIIKNVSQALSSEEQDYLKEIKGRKEEVGFGSLHLAKWDGTPESLRKILHKRGINRVAKALFGAHASLLWHISHRIDRNRAAALHKLCTDIKNNEAKERLIHDILELIPKK